MPATGWNARFDRVTGMLNLPPGHRLITALGADSAPDAWVEQWGLWGLFGVLVVAVFAGWLGGWVVGAVAFVALLLTYQEAPEYIWLWSNLLAALALARAAPEGKLQRFARRYRAVSFVVLGVALLPLLWSQARVVMFAWALWLVLALLRWLRWGWQAWKTNGIWRGPAETATATA
jgi:hypothetical protein